MGEFGGVFPKFLICEDETDEFSWFGPVLEQNQPNPGIVWNFLIYSFHFAKYTTVSKITKTNLQPSSPTAVVEATVVRYSGLVTRPGE
jgi:hypothetical protein